MASTKSSSEASTSRAPFADVTDLTQVPPALFEIQVLAESNRSGHIVPLIRSIIETTLKDPQAWQKVAEMSPKQ